MRTNGPSESHNRHKKSFSQQVEDVIRTSDIILETVDARFVKESRIPELEEKIDEMGKVLVHVVTKIDMIDKDELEKLRQRRDLSHPVLVSATKRIGLKNLRDKIHILAKKVENFENVHIGVIGYPNTGKSTVISLLARRAAAPVSSHAGFTKHIRKIRFSKKILLLDAPGVVQGNENLFEGNEDLKKHALLGVHVPETVRNPELIVSEIMKRFPGKLEKYYEIEANGDPEILINSLGEKWRMLRKKGMIDTDRVSRRILKDWHTGKK